MGGLIDRLVGQLVGRSVARSLGRSVGQQEKMEGVWAERGRVGGR